MGQLADAKARLAQATTEEEQKVEREAGEGQKRLKTMQAEVENSRRKVGESGWSEEKEREESEGPLQTWTLNTTRRRALTAPESRVS
ncbi:hypothetical protein DAEQUDRAFT_599623 [Daedalea quercina L-15889]|uniref:Uncharacterized protein n=1 Tax=Daedalea quercina L-15889 TaxID=1314783 RepID=A0A165LPZ8_9APHY|nr:hypothetical protein DAEQUDRAFT_599623 [Daedalea quercina L-15889]